MEGICLEIFGTKCFCRMRISYSGANRTSLRKWRAFRACAMWQQVIVNKISLS